MSRKYLTPSQFGKLVGLPSYRVKAMLDANNLDYILGDNGTRMIAADASTPSAIVVRRDAGGTPEKRCASCHHWLTKVDYGKGKWSAPGSKCKDCESAAQAFRMYRAKCPVLDAAYTDAIARDKEILAARKSGRLLAPHADRIEAHAAAIAMSGAAGDGRKWGDE